jgi:hypothetical protein
MQKLCSQDSSGKGKHCFCIDIDTQRGVKKCCKCNQWNVQGNDWTKDEDFR